MNGPEVVRPGDLGAPAPSLERTELVGFRVRLDAGALRTEVVVGAFAPE
ncbi:hypothetical protein NX794_19505 [Streptomyces sp. LP11]|uniref:Uncharacterized protein n=1 Tax=Streptomyces pyxinicus TaxID=2970331 RepID=A0ABT2B4C7_9ACTN|nr:hypothetical protein [Streptomyces sp. LP11]MCS0603383.1 hypothetical protein [Streptomyces sp. LP11]